MATTIAICMVAIATMGNSYMIYKIIKAVF